MQAEWKIKGIYKADAQRVADETGEGRVPRQEGLERQEMKIRNCTSALNGMIVLLPRNTDYNRQEQSL